MDKHKLSESDISDKFVRPAMVQVGWHTLDQIYANSFRLTDVSGALLALPPLAEQSRIVARVASLSTLCTDLRQRRTSACTQQPLLAESLIANV